jgi:hypothetical protein
MLVIGVNKVDLGHLKAGKMIGNSNISKEGSIDL